MDNNHGFVDLLHSQTSFDLDSPEPAWFSTQGADECPVKERRKWSPKEDKILIGAWLNTSKDPVVSNEQKAAALREQRSGQNDDDVMKAALDLFYNDYGIKFSLEHAWRKLRHDKKWCSTFQSKDTVDGEEEVGGPEGRPAGVKAAKAATKRKKSGKEEELSQLQAMLKIKEIFSKRKLLDLLLARKDPLSEMETSLKLKIMFELL
ncbi:hypothetical protein N665_1895s0005 [Sinapis alba]|nr:hypothetical protein N665_1895s0005 [Sinapis alba]